jgi:hypothetical protein
VGILQTKLVPLSRRIKPRKHGLRRAFGKAEGDIALIQKNIMVSLRTKKIPDTGIFSV